MYQIKTCDINDVRYLVYVSNEHISYLNKVKSKAYDSRKIIYNKKISNLKLIAKEAEAAISKGTFPIDFEIGSQDQYDVLKMAMDEFIYSRLNKIKDLNYEKVKEHSIDMYSVSDIKLRILFIL